MKRWLFLIALLLAAPWARAADSDEFLLGVGMHFGNAGAGDVATNLDLFDQAGLNAVRDERSWRFVEWNKGELRYFRNNFIEQMIDRLDAEGKVYINILAYGSPFYGDGDYPRTPETIEAFCRYAEFVAGETAGKATYQQVWNEWDCGTSMPPQFKDTADYGVYCDLLKAVAPRIRAADPETKIMSTSATMVFKLENMLKAGVLDYVDVISFHPYVSWRGRGKDTVEFWYGLMTRAEEVIRRYHGGETFPTILTEIGWPASVGENGWNEETQAEYAAQLLLTVRMFPWVKGLLWYDFQNDGTDVLQGEQNFGLIRSDATPKPVYYVFADLSELVRRGEFVRRIDVGDPKIWLLQYRLGGRDVAAMWNAYPDRDTEVILSNRAAVKTPLYVRHAGRPAVRMNWGRRDWLKQEPRRDDELAFTLRGMPLLLEGDLSRVEWRAGANREAPREPMRQ